MAAFLSAREKNGRLERHGWEKEVEIFIKEGKEGWAKVLKLLKVQKHPSFLSRTWRNILNQGEAQQVRWSFPLKRAW